MIFDRCQALVLDVDGTLYCERRLRWRLAPRLAAGLALAGRDGFRALRVLAEYRRQLELMRALPAGQCLPDSQVKRTARRTGMPESFVAACVARWFEDAPLAELASCRRPGLIEFLDRALAAGIRLAALSDYPPEKKLLALGVRRYFEVVAWSGEPAIAALKPHPAGLLHVLGRLNVDPAGACYIGDRPEIDGETARRAGCRALLVGRSPGAHDFRALAARLGP